MFDWVYNILYGLTKILLQIINYIMLAVNKISGIDSINFNGEETDFISYLIQSEKVTYVFAITSIIGFILLILLTVIQIVMTYTKEKNEESPLQVAKRAAKNILLLLLVPTFMVSFILLTNAFVKALYQATQVGSTSLSQYMFGIFAEPAMLSGTSLTDIFDHNIVPFDGSNSTRWSYLDMSDFSYFYSYLIGGLVVYLLLSTAMMLVERAISIVFLYIISPFVVASSVMDDGAKFKSWRDQILLKFLTGHGAIIAINIYIMVCGLVIDPRLKFFDDNDLNNFMKLLFVIGGAFAVKQTQAIVGNLIQVGAGDKAIAENERATASMGGALKSPYSLLKKGVNFGRDWHEYGLGSTVANRLGFKTARDYGGQSKAQKNLKGERDRAKEQRDIRQAQRIADIIKGNGGENNANNPNNNTNNINSNANNNNIDQLGEGGKKKSLGEQMVDNVNSGGGDLK